MEFYSLLDYLLNTCYNASDYVSENVEYADLVLIFLFSISLYYIAKNWIFVPQTPVNLKARAWKSNSAYFTAADYPETSLKELQDKPSTAICFSGGGARAMIGAFGFLGGLRDLGLLDKIRYMGGISGGSWATTVYLYGKFPDPASNDDDLKYLGRIMDPEEITYENLNHINDGCVRRLGSRTFLNRAYARLMFKRAESWIISISQALLEPVGIKRGKLYTWSKATRDAILNRNIEAGLVADDFLLPRKEKGPFFVIGWTIAGPQQGYLDPPYNTANHRFNFFETTPLYVGTMRSFSEDYNIAGTTTIQYGGMIEPFAFAVKGGKAPLRGIPAHETTAMLDVPKPTTMLDLTNVASTSSLNPSALFESFYILDVIFDWVYSYWSPAMEKPVVTPISFTDGGYSQNLPLTSFIQRGVKKIVLVAITYVPFDYCRIKNSGWHREPHKIGTYEFDSTIAAFFGIMPDRSKDTRFADKEFGGLNAFEKLHVFETEEFQILIDGLYAALKVGKGLFFRHKFTTVTNGYYRIQAGQKIDVTFYLNNMCEEWKNKLEDERIAIDVLNSSIPTKTGFIKSFFAKPKEFASFPHYILDVPRYTHRESNLLANMTGWAVKENEALMRDVFSFQD